MGCKAGKHQRRHRGQCMSWVFFHTRSAPPTLRSMPQRQQLHSMAEQGNSCREKKIGIIQCSCHMLDMWPHLNTLTTRSWSMWSRSTFMFLIQALCESWDSSAFRRCSQSLVYENTIFICVCLPTHFACREKKEAKQYLLCTPFVDVSVVAES